MKRRMQLITAFLLMLTLAVSGTYVFAGASDEPGDVQEGLEVTEPAPDQSVDLEGAPELEAAPEGVEPADGEEVEGPVDAAGAVDATDEVEPPAAVKGAAKAVEPEAAEEPGEVEPMTWVDNKLKATTLTYNTTKRDPGENLYAPGGSTYGVAEIKVSANGKLYVTATPVSSTTQYFNLVVGTNYDSATQTLTTAGTSGYLSSSYPKDTFGGIDVKAGGTYYVGVQSYNGGTVNVQPFVYSYDTRTLGVGKMMLTSCKKGTGYSTALFRIKPTKTGYIRVTAKEYGNNYAYGKITLLNSSKKAVSESLRYSSSSKTGYVAFGVKKGVTYYLKANDFVGNYYNQNIYGLKFKVYGSALRKNTTKKKAKTLKRKAKFISTAIPANGKKGNQWYKFKVPKKQATQIRINMANVKSGKIKATVYYGKKKVASTSLVNGTTNTLKLTYSTSYGKAKKGTYYLKLSKSAKTNGSYKIRYLK